MLTESGIKALFKQYDGLREAWADRCGITVHDDRCVHGWPKNFSYFVDGWTAAIYAKESAKPSVNKQSAPCKCMHGVYLDDCRICDNK